MKDFGTLKLLCETAGVSGYERGISEVVRNQFSKYCDEVVVDEFNNVVGIMKSTENRYLNDRPLRLMYVAHIDEIGLLVKKIEKGGFVRVCRIAGVDPKTLLSTRVVIHGNSGKVIEGVVVSLPPHLSDKDDKDKAPEFDEIFIDTGLSDEELAANVSVGDFVTYKQELKAHNSYVCSGKALDDRVGVMALINMMQNLKNKRFQHDLIFVASICEEFNSFGATIAATNLEPDIAVAIDVTHGKPGKDSGDEKTFICGGGPVVLISPILNKKITHKLIDICKGKEFENGVEVDNKDTGTDAKALTLSGSGTPCAVLSIPLKYMHTQVEMLDVRDIESCAEVLTDFTLLNYDVMRDLLCY